MLIVYGFLALILAGTMLLSLPVSNKTGEFTPVLTALFTSTSAVCVTGLVVVDTGTYWSSFGQAIIFSLFQIGGFGFMTSATLLLLAFGHRIGLRERILISESLSLQKLGGVVQLVRKMALFTIIAEGLGALIFFLRFWPELPPLAALWKATFHSVSAFNNAGFDLFGDFRSLIDFQNDPIMLLATALLIVLGGISFIVVANVMTERRFSRFSLDTKIVLVTSATLLALGTIVILATEFANPDTLGVMSYPMRVVNAFFQSATSRTTGFSSFDTGAMANYSLFFIIMLMFIGGAAGSTAGGIKVNSLGLLAATVWSSVTGKQYAGAFGKEFREDQMYRALAILMVSLGLVATTALILSSTEHMGFMRVLFESVSAFGTVGLSTGITPDLSVGGELVIIFAMFAGRLGPLTLVLQLVQRQHAARYRFPEEQVRIG